MPLQGDYQYTANWSNTTTPAKPDGFGNTAVTLAGYTLTNTANASRTVKFWDKASSPAINSDVPCSRVTVPANATITHDFVRGKRFLAGMWVSVTTEQADSGTTAPASGDILMTIDYQP